MTEKELIKGLRMKVAMCGTEVDNLVNEPGLSIQCKCDGHIQELLPTYFLNIDYVEFILLCNRQTIPKRKRILPQPCSFFWASSILSNDVI